MVDEVHIACDIAERGVVGRWVPVRVDLLHADLVQSRGLLAGACRGNVAGAVRDVCAGGAAAGTIVRIIARTRPWVAVGVVVVVHAELGVVLLEFVICEVADHHPQRVGVKELVEHVAVGG